MFTLITLPVEFNASRRAGENLVDYGVIDARDEKKVNAMLRAAGMTYVMSFAMALLQMLRIIAIFGGSRSKKNNQFISVINPSFTVKSNTRGVIIGSAE